MDEMYRMLGRERQADLEREAEGRRLAAAVRGARPGAGLAKSKLPRWKSVGLVPSRLAAFLR